mgnify:CR=1 FL=1
MEKGSPKNDKKNSENASKRRAGDRHQEYFDDHRALQGVLGRLEGTSDIRLLIPLLEELHRLLLGHFAREEAPDGFQGIVEESAPHHLDKLQELMNEHKGFLQSLNEIKRSAQECVNGPMADIFKDVNGLCDRLHDHEARETRLLTEALYTDLGESS